MIFINTTLFILLIAFSQIHTSIYRNTTMIKDLGFIKISFFNLGILLYYISNYFSSKSNQSSCGLYSIFKHTGIILIYYITFMYIYSGSQLGISLLTIEEQKNVSAQSSTDLQTYKNIKDAQSKNNYINRFIKRDEDKELSSYELRKNENMYKLYIQSKKIKSLYRELFIILILFVITNIVVTIIYTKNKGNYDDYLKQNFSNGKWSYICPLEKFDLIINIIEFLLIIILVRHSFKLWTLTGIFKNTLHMSYTVILWIVIGPLANVNIY